MEHWREQIRPHRYITTGRSFLQRSSLAASTSSAKLGTFPSTPYSVASYAILCLLPPTAFGSTPPIKKIRLRYATLISSLHTLEL